MPSAVGAGDRRTKSREPQKPRKTSMAGRKNQESREGSGEPGKMVNCNGFAGVQAGFSSRFWYQSMNLSGGNPGANRKPCRWSHPISARICADSRVSTPSATTRRPSRCDRPMIDAVISRSRCDVVMLRTKLLSILTSL